MKRRILAFLLVLCLTAALPITVLAAQETEMVCWTQTEPGKLSMLLAYQAEEGTYSASLDGVELKLNGGTVSEERVPVSLYCLVDTSGSISKFKMKIIRNTLKTISQSMAQGDNMILAAVDNTVKESEPLTTVDTRQDAIDAIAASNKYTNLYAGIVSGLDRLASATDLNPVRALVVLSDGMDKQDNGMTEQEVRDAVAKTRIPIFTVALLEGYNERYGGKVLGSFARNSCGGMHLSTVSEGSDGKVRWNVTGKEFGEAIWNSIAGSQYLSAELDGLSLDTSKSALRLSVSYTTANSSYVDSMDIDASSIVTVSTEPIAEETSGPEDDEANSSESAPEKTVPGYVWGIAAAVVLVAVIVILLAVKKNKDKKAEDQRRAEEEARRKAEEEEARQRAEEDLENTRPLEEPEPEQEPPAAPQRIVELVDIPHGEHPCKFTVAMDQPVTFGRNAKAQCVIDGDDKKLSGRHFALLINQNLICIRDEQSTNGTFLNGIPVSSVGWSKVESGDKIRAGSREYRMTIRE